jgi:hypothetical protein
MSAILWLNVGLGAVFFGLLVGASLWLVLKHPDRAPAYHKAVIPGQRQAPTSPERRYAYSAGSAGPAGSAGSTGSGWRAA